MINKFKHNTKIKVIAILSAMALWMYVMLAVDPQESKLIENIPVHITNTAELEDRGFVIYPDEEITANVTVTGQLSKVKSINKDKIYVYGEIKKPIEGQNDMYLKVNVSETVDNTVLRSPVAMVNLERVVKKDKAIKVNIEGAKKDDISEVKLEKNKVKVSGPRSMVNKVKNVEAELNVETGKDNFTRNFKLVPIDENGEKVEDVVLSTYYVKADVEMYKQKTVPIKFNIKEDNEDIKSYDVSTKEVVIKGKKEAIEAVGSIETELIDLSQLEDSNEIKVNLIVPDGVNIEFSTITVSKKPKELANKSFTFSADEIELRKSEDVEGEENTIISPNEIRVDVEYDSDLGEVKKSDIKLYLDLTQQSVTDSKYVIKYESNFNFKNVKITPNIVEVE